MNDFNDFSDKNEAHRKLVRIVEFYDAYQQLDDTQNCVDGYVEIDGDKFYTQEDVMDLMQDMPLSVEMRSVDWQQFGEPNYLPDEYRIVLTSGGPNTQVFGTLDSECEAGTAEIQYWHASKMVVLEDLSKHEQDALLWFAQEFTLM
ncbi:MAG: hypothetical protein OXD01_05085 [Gammaproteobacteria bacterium]|nr:hypothetical protein [Gammaproteobacteria bacterium]